MPVEKPQRMLLEMKVKEHPLSILIPQREATTIMLLMEMEIKNLVVPIMNTQIKYEEIWIALANIEVDRIRSNIKNADYAYVTVLGLAKGKIDFRQRVAKALSLQYFRLLRLEEVERLINRIEKFEVESSILKLAEELLNDGTDVKFVTFHTYD